MSPLSYVVGVGALVVFVLAFLGYKRTGSPSALISGSLGAALMLLGLGISLSGRPHLMAAIPCFIVALAFAARGMVAKKKGSSAASLILSIAAVAALAGVGALLIP